MPPTVRLTTCMPTAIHASSGTPRYTRLLVHVRHMHPHCPVRKYAPRAALPTLAHIAHTHTHRQLIQEALGRHFSTHDRHIHTAVTTG